MNPEHNSKKHVEQVISEESLSSIEAQVRNLETDLEAANQLSDSPEKNAKIKVVTNLLIEARAKMTEKLLKGDELYTVNSTTGIETMTEGEKGSTLDQDPFQNDPGSNASWRSLNNQ